MDPRLLDYYNRELQHLREMGAEFALEFPKIAARLGINGLEVADPYVERLLEGVGFLAARVQLKLDAEFPRFTQALLEMVHPHYLVPTPSMLIAQLKPDPGEPNLASGFTVPRGSPMNGQAGADDVTACQFRTAHDVTLWPLELTSAAYFSFAPDLPLNTLPFADRIKGGVRIRLRTTAGLKVQQTAIDRLAFYFGGRDDVANRLCELCLSSGLGVLAVSGKGTARRVDLLSSATIRPLGFEDDQALLPVTLRSFQGYRLLQEYFAFPSRFRFCELSGLAPGIKAADTDAVELVVLLGRGDAALESMVDSSNLTLFCTPAINLFPKRADRIHVTDATHEYHVVPDRTRPLDFEVYEVADVIGHGTGMEVEQQFLPFYSADARPADHRHSAYFVTRREPRLASSTQKRRGPRSSYSGTEVFLSLVDPAQAPFSGNLRQLSVQTLCTNRDLVLQMPVGGGRSDLSLDVAAPVPAIRVVSGPSRPLAPLVDGPVAWRAISHLSLNYYSLVNSSPEQGASVLRDLLSLYAPVTDAGARRQIEGIRSVSVKPVVRRLPAAGPVAFGRGIAITVDVDDMAFEGGSAFLVGAVLERFFARHASIDSFTETTLRSQGRGDITWVPQWGARPTL